MAPAGWAARQPVWSHLFDFYVPSPGPYLDGNSAAVDLSADRILVAIAGGADGETDVHFSVARVRIEICAEIVRQSQPDIAIAAAQQPPRLRRGRRAHLSINVAVASVYA